MLMYKALMYLCTISKKAKILSQSGSPAARIVTNYLPKTSMVDLAQHLATHTRKVITIWHENFT